MLPLLQPSEILSFDKVCSDECGLKPIDLMEQAAAAATRHLLEAIEPLGIGPLSVLIACGAGNNGGDGFVIARLLRDESSIRDVVVVTSSKSESMTTQARVNRERLPHEIQSISFDQLSPHTKFNVVVDALIGAGGSAELRGLLPSQVAVLNAYDAFKVAIDVPTGLHPVTGKAHPDVFRADMTITLETQKPGFFRNDGPMCVGRVVVAPIGVASSLAARFSTMFRYEHNDIRGLLQKRNASTSKFDYGRVLVIGGTRGMPGAPSMSAHAALAIGAGLVELAAPFIHPLTPREIMTTELISHDDGTIHEDAEQTLRTMMNRSTVCAIGPGLGTNVRTLAMLATLIDEIAREKPIVIDAEGLRAFPLFKYRGPNIILTPHKGEFARLKNMERKDLAYDTVEEAKTFALDKNITLHLKDVPSLTTDGKTSFLTTNGNPYMATAGSGDVLTGVIAGLLAQGLAPIVAASLGAYIHAEAGDSVSSSNGQQPMMAGDIIRHLHRQ